MKREKEVYKQAFQIDMEAQSLFTEIIKQGISTKYQNQLYKELKQLIKRYPKATSSVCQSLTDTLTDVYTEQGYLNDVYISASEFDKLLIERYTQMVKQLPKDALKAFKETSTIIGRLAVNNDLTIEQAINYYTTLEEFRGLYVRDGANRRYKFKDIFRRLLRDTVKDSTRDSCERLANELDTNIYQISSHAHPREKCRPYEKKLVSDKRGTTTDLNGKKLKVIAWSDTTEGQGDGLFGYNCRHIKFPWVAGISRLPKDPLGEVEKELMRYENKITKQS